ncbi:acylphosphatase [Lachnospiraceae bacterium]|nr:acylphosphatase [Lachnospiraceae bacterium]
MIIRRHMFISGDVQGVGFRYRANYAAKGLGLTGFVRNLYDGRVEIEVQGERELIPRFLGEIDAGRFVHIDDIESKDIPIIEDERSFRVKHDGY